MFKIYSFDIKTKIIYGDNALDHLLDIPFNKIMIITDAFIVESGLINMITDRLVRRGKAYEIYSDVVPDPPIDKIALGVKALLEYNPDGLITIGGGSAIDTAKAIREIYRHSEGNGQALPLIAIPTTSGTGSEVTSFSVVTDTKNQVKYPLVSEELLPTEAILDAELTCSVPPVITADTGMDVFTHALEAYVSTKHSEFSDALAEKSIEICGTFLLRSYLDGKDRHARSKMHVASCLAGLAFNAASLGINHSMAHQLGAHFHIPHGRANAMLLPLIIEYNTEIDKRSKSRTEYPKHVKKYVTIARILGLQNFNTITTVRALVNWIQFMLEEMDMPHSVEETRKCTKEEYFKAIPAMADAALADTCTPTNPRVPSREDIIGIYERLW